MTANRTFDVAVVGATGYTGRQIARELVAAGSRVLCVGRNRQNLDRTVAELGSVASATVDLDNTDAVRDICAEAVTVVNAAGSFIETGIPVARAAIAAGTHYVDISGEQQSIDRLYGSLHDAAVAAGVALVPSAAFYSTLADWTATVLADHNGPEDGVNPAFDVDSIDIAYHIENWTPSGAAYANFLRGIENPIIQWRDGQTTARRPHTRPVDFGPEVGTRTAVTYPAPEVFTIPRHLTVDQVSTSMTAATFDNPVPERLSAMATRGMTALMRTPMAPIVRRGFGRALGGSVTRIDADPTLFTIVVTVEANGVTERAVVRGHGIFDITAPIAAHIALATTADGFDQAGGLSSAQVCDPPTLMASLADHGVRMEVDSPAS
ncbi:saccharopine dehydrogenase NADP-binding domain-containing protein [Gordonia sp. ABSL1-1]|uniref:saccharopine dehydrogenase NADP-binding domain-containing protein n=1 Tax=Gordonia sp. ABSL1-1 TaxID=3053923 RepID=UPI0025724440|nr:saccharopine dehydrogenase NADP-binding domain-containing protein [Gordonia sp. ABSL1-1]MDL9935950.1 saccharopine dehydrogenase NADP-binding domain-containing protein [Gordonia sp. ABSL1-1]